MCRKLFVPLTFLALCLVASVAGAAKPTAGPYRAIDLNPGGDPILGIIGSWAYGVDSGQQGGAYTWGAIPSWKSRRAMLWTGTAASAVDLNPAGFTFSNISGVGGGQQVGWGNVYYVWSNPKTSGGGIVDYYEAVLWTGSAENAVNLHPAGFGQSMAADTDGAQQVGSGQISTYSRKNGGSSVTHTHALLWTGSAESAVDLNPDWLGCTDSSASGVADRQQVGVGHFYYLLSKNAGYVNENHALLWTGDAASAIDLHPTGFTSSAANGVGGGQQVGYGILADGAWDALLWTGDAASVVEPAGRNLSHRTNFGFHLRYLLLIRHSAGHRHCGPGPPSVVSWHRK